MIHQIYALDLDSENTSNIVMRTFSFQVAGLSRGTKEIDGYADEDGELLTVQLGAIRMVSIVGEQIFLIPVNRAAYF